MNEKGGKRDTDDGPPVIFGIDTSGRQSIKDIDTRKSDHRYIVSPSLYKPFIEKE